MKEGEENKFLSKTEIINLFKRLKGFPNNVFASFVRLIQKECLDSVEDNYEETLKIRIEN